MMQTLSLIHILYDESLKLYFPYKDYNIKSGDKFVLLYIDMPDVYIQDVYKRQISGRDSPKVE